MFLACFVFNFEFIKINFEFKLIDCFELPTQKYFKLFDSIMYFKAYYYWTKERQQD